MFLAFSVRRRPATGELMVETQANSPFRVGNPGGHDFAVHLHWEDFAGLTLNALGNCSSRTEGKFLSYCIFYRMLLLFGNRIE